jgi:hypothetical protein
MHLPVIKLCEEFMNRRYQYISRFLVITILAIAFPTISPAWSKPTGAIQPRKGDAIRLRSVQGQPIVPTNSDRFNSSQDPQNSNLKIQKVNIQFEPVESVVPSNYNASPQRVNKSGGFSSDPLNAIPIF